MRYVDAIFLGKKVQCDCHLWFEVRNEGQKQNIIAVSKLLLFLFNSNCR